MDFVLRRNEEGKLRFGFESSRSDFLGGTSLGSLERPSGDLLDIWQTDPPMPGGVYITQDNSLKQVAVFNAVRALSQTVASLPFHLYEQSGDSRLRVTDDPRSDLLDRSPNPEMSAYELWELLCGHLALWGNAYLYRDFSPATGLTVALWPLVPSQTRPVRTANGEKHFVTRLATGEERFIDNINVIHLKAFSTDGDVGLSPIGQARRAVGLAVASEEYALKFFDNNASSSGFVKYPGSPNDEQFQKMISRLRQSHSGLKNAHKAGILTGGADWVSTGIPSEDALFINARKYQDHQIAGLIGVPSFLIGDLEGLSQYKTLDEANRGFLTYQLRSWLTRIEQRINLSVFSSSIDRDRGLYAEFKVDSLLRADTKTRYESYAIALGKWMSGNEIRALENLPSVEGLDEVKAAPPPMPVMEEPEEDEDEERSIPEIHIHNNGSNGEVTDILKVIAERDPSPHITVHPADVTVEKTPGQVAIKSKVRKKIVRNDQGEIDHIIEEEVDE